MTEKPDAEVPKLHVPAGLPSVIAIAVVCAGVLVAWGAQQTKLSVLESRVGDQALEQQQTKDQLAKQETEIAVTNTEYVEIIRRLDEISHKIEVANK